MLTVLCILWVANMSAACAESNKVWWLNVSSACALTVSIMVMV